MVLTLYVILFDGDSITGKISYNSHGEAM